MKSIAFSGLTWDRSDASKTNWPTHDPNLFNKEVACKSTEQTGMDIATHAPRNEFRGKSVMRTQYAKQAIPESIVNSMNVSMSFNLAGVESL